MLKIIFNLAVFAAIIAVLFYIVRLLVMLWTGWTKEEAAENIRSFVSDRQDYHLAADQTLNVQLWEAVRDIIGEARFDGLCRLARTARLYETGNDGGLPFVRLTVVCATASEQQRLENILSDIVAERLRTHNLDGTVLTTWETNSWLQMPSVKFRFAESQKEKEILNGCLRDDALRVLRQNHPLVDEDLL